MKYLIKFKGIELEIKRLPNGKFRKPDLGLFTKQGLGCTWLDDGRIPYNNEKPNVGGRLKNRMGDGYGFKERKSVELKNGRFPANLLVSDNTLNDGKITKSGKDAVR